MSAIKSLLAATDLSDDARNAAYRAALLAAEQQAQLTLLHVMSGPSLDSLRPLYRVPEDAETKLIADAERMLNELSADIARKTQLAPTARVRVGRVLDEILSASAQADMLVVGAHGWNPVRDMILGTTAQRLLHKSTRPVLTAKRAPQGTYRRVLVPVDFSPYSAAALKMALLIAPHADITVVHAFDVPMEGKLWLADVSGDQIQKYRIQARQKALDNIELLIKEVAGGSLRCFRDVVHGAAAPVILDKEAERDADLIVIGKHGQTMVEELLLGSVTHHVLSDAKCDVLVVHERFSTGVD